MRSKEDRNWELIASMLAEESSGRTRTVFSSKRTLFGIPSTLDQELEKLAKASSESPEDEKSPSSESEEDGQ